MIINKKYPNIIIFHHNDNDGIATAFIIKMKYDNNLQNDAWEKNVTCIPCNYNSTFDLDFFKEEVEKNYKTDQENIVFMVDYAIQPNNFMLNFWNWLTDRNCKFYWIDHHITAIENLKHLNIPGIQESINSGCMNTWNFIMQNNTVPMVIRFINDFDIWNKNSEFSWDKQLYPLCYFLESLGNTLNDNTSELVTTLQNMIKDNNYTNKCINIGKYIYKYVSSQIEANTKRIYPATWNNYKCLLLNSSTKGSTQFEQYENWKDYDLLISWSFNGKKYIYGIYSSNPKINVGKICKECLHGGGHKGAGGGESDKFLIE